MQPSLCLRGSRGLGSAVRLTQPDSSSRTPPPPPPGRPRSPKTVQSAEGGEGKDNRERIICGCLEAPLREILQMHTPAHKSVLASANPRTDSACASGCPWSTARATAPSPGRPTPGVVKQDKSSEGSVDTTKTRSGPQRVRMSSGETCGAGPRPAPEVHVPCASTGRALLEGEGGHRGSPRAVVERSQGM